MDKVSAELFCFTYVPPPPNFTTNFAPHLNTHFPPNFNTDFVH
jgi:hypothetical protein